MSATRTQAPERSLAQRLDALQRATDIRKARATLLTRMARLAPAASCQMAAEIVEDPPEVLAGLSVGALLKRVHNLGPVAARAVVAAARVDSAVSLGALTGEQRAALTAVLSVRRHILSTSLSRMGGAQ